MDMKRILQAIDNVSTTPVVGADSMAKFLRVVKEADMNQSTEEPSEPIVPPDMPDVANLTPGVTKDLGDGNAVTLKANGTVSYTGGFGEYVYDNNGKAIKYTSPSFSGMTKSVDLLTNKTTTSYESGPLKFQKGPEGNKASYDLGIGVANMQQEPGQAPTGSMDIRSGDVQEGTLNKFLNIIKRNDVKILNEGNSPHKVALPIQMAMQHYQQPEKILERKKSVIYKYFEQIEEEQLQEQADKRQLLNQYASQIAERVIGKNK